MSDFFEPPPPPPEPPPHERRQPEWFGPADNVLGVLVALDLVLARTDDVALVVPAATVYPNGVLFAVVLLLRQEPKDPFGWHPFHPHGRGEIGPEQLRLGVQFADGAKATTLGLPFFPRVEERPPGPVLMPRGGGGGGRRWDVSFWLWPLPPPGPLALVCEWPARGIELTRVEVDAKLLLDAAVRAEPLWPDGDSDPGSGGWVSSMRVG